MKFTRDLNPKIDEKIVSQFEKTIGWDLPVSYREFLLNHNGGVPERQFLVIPDCEAETTIYGFRGINTSSRDLLKIMKEWYSDLWGKFVPIAYDGGGNNLLMDRRDGQIWYWDSARHFPGSSDDKNTYRVAFSFDDLLDRLTLVLTIPTD